MKADTVITTVSITLVALALIMTIAAFSFHGGNGFFNMGAHHSSVTSGAVTSSQIVTTQ